MLKSAVKAITLTWQSIVLAEKYLLCNVLGVHWSLVGGGMIDLPKRGRKHFKTFLKGHGVLKGKLNTLFNTQVRTN